MKSIRVISDDGVFKALNPDDEGMYAHAVTPDTAVVKLLNENWDYYQIGLEFE